MSGNDEYLAAAFREISVQSNGKVEFRSISTQELAVFLDRDIGRSPNPIYSFDIISTTAGTFKSIAYSLSLDGTRRVATRAEALSRGLALADWALYECNPFLLIFDYVGRRLMGVSAAKLFGAFAREAARRPIALSNSSAFALTPNFDNRTISMYVTVGAPDIWYHSFADSALSADELVARLEDFQLQTEEGVASFPEVIEAIAARLGHERDLGNPPPAISLTAGTVSNSDEPEGIEGSEQGTGWGDYPLDAVFVRTEPRSVSEVVKRIQNERYILDPDFQRDFVWPSPKQSKLIESCVMRIPLPVFYVAEGRDGRIIVVDGLQRLTTFARFLGNDLKLSGLSAGEGGKEKHPLDGKFFADLSLNLQERIQDTQLTMYILDAKAPERARLDIFERVNSGEPLTRQQMRNALYNGPATQWLKRAALGAAFQAASGGSLSSKTMRDREAINRFCAFKILGRKRYVAGDMDSFLAQALIELARLSDGQRATILSAFERAMLLNRSLFGEHAFRKSLASRAYSDRSVINISLFEVCAVTMSDEAVALAAESAPALLRNAVADLVRDEEFAKAITYSTNSTTAVQSRFSLMERALASVVR